MSQSRAQWKAKTILHIRISFLVYLLLLAVLCINLLFVVDKTFLNYEMILVGIAYLYSLRIVFRNMDIGAPREMGFYFLAHVLVAVGVVFLLIADRFSTNFIPQNNSVE